MSILRNVPNGSANGNNDNLLSTGPSGTPPNQPTGSATCLSDTLFLLKPAMGFIIHAAGVMVVYSRDQMSLAPGDRVTTTLPALAVGIPIPLQICGIMDTGTTVTAANITLLYGDYLNAGFGSGPC